MLFHLSLYYAGLDPGRSFLIYHLPLCWLLPLLSHFIHLWTHPGRSIEGEREKAPPFLSLHIILHYARHLPQVNGSMTGVTVDGTLSSDPGTVTDNLRGKSLEVLSPWEGLFQPVGWALPWSTLLPEHGVNHARDTRKTWAQVLVNLSPVFLQILSSFSAKQKEEDLNHILPNYGYCALE